MSEVAVVNRINEINMEILFQIKTRADWRRTALPKNQPITLVVTQDTSSVDKMMAATVINNAHKNQVVTFKDLLDMMHADSLQFAETQKAADGTVAMVDGKPLRKMIDGQKVVLVKQHLQAQAETFKASGTPFTFPDVLTMSGEMITIGANQSYLTNNTSGARNAKMYPQLAEMHNFEYVGKDVFPLFVPKKTGDINDPANWVEVKRNTVTLGRSQQMNQTAQTPPQVNVAPAEPGQQPQDVPSNQ